MPAADPAVPRAVRVADTDTLTLHDDESPDGAARESNARQAVHLRPGELIPGTRYRLVRWLGDGGMGTVFEAVQEDLDRRVALKVLRDALSQTVVDLFRTEAKILGRLGSRFVVDVYDLIELRDGRLMIAMELLRGEDLRGLLDRGGPVPLERIIAIGRQICKGLGAAHDAGIVHRDVKPENISLEVVEGRGDAVKLLDFGISQVGEGSQESGSRAGTPGYLAPEVITGSGGDRRTDLYALGCVLYELATGRVPFTKKFVSDVLTAHLDETPRPPSAHVACPPSFDAVVLRCLEKDPGRRYQNAAALEAGLCEVQIARGIHTEWDDLPLPAIEGEALERLGRRMPTPRMQKRRWLPWAVAGTLAVATLAGTVGYAVRSDVAAAKTDLAEADRLIEGARAAASRAFFVYPPPENPSLRTALGFIIDLEALDGKAAQYGLEQGDALRTEFADTLERLGDEYWEADGGKPFALDYYAEALMFDSKRTRARQRASMTPGELRLLRDKAMAGTFSKQELTDVEPLIALADVTPEERERRIESIEAKSPHAKARSRRLRAVAKSRGVETRPAEPAVPVEADEPESIGADEPRLDLGVDPIEIAELDEEPVANPELARKRTAAADSAHRNGRSAQAEKLYVEALAADGRHAAAHRGLGRVAFDRGSYALASRRLKKAVRLAPRNAGYRIELGDALFKSFKYDAAHAQYARAKELGSSVADGRLAKVANKR